MRSQTDLITWTAPSKKRRPDADIDPCFRELLRALLCPWGLLRTWIGILALAACRPSSTEPDKPAKPPSQDGRTGTVLASEDADIGDLVVDATHVYWLEDAPKSTLVMRAAKTGGQAPARIGNVEGGCTRLAVDESRVYCIADKGVWAAPKAGGAAALLGLPTDCVLGCALALDAKDIYFSQPNGIAKVAKSGGPASIFAADRVQAGAIAVTPTRVVWSTPLRAGANAAIKAAAKATGKTETLVADAHLLSEGSPIFADDKTVHYVVGYSLWSVPVAGGEPKEALALPGLGRGIAMENGDVFWSAEVKHIGAARAEQATPLVGDPTRRREVTVGGGRAQGEGGLMKNAGAGGAAVPLTKEHTDVAAVAVDSTAVYWVEKPPRKIRRLAR